MSPELTWFVISYSYDEAALIIIKLMYDHNCYRWQFCLMMIFEAKRFKIHPLALMQYYIWQKTIL